MPSRSFRFPPAAVRRSADAHRADASRRGIRFLLILLMGSIVVGSGVRSTMAAFTGEAFRGGAGHRDSDETRDRWFACTLGGKPCGNLLERTRTLADGSRCQETELLLRFIRDGVATDTRISSRMVTDIDGTLQEMEVIQALGKVPVRSTWRFRGDEVEEIRSQGARSERTIRPRPREPWFTPSAALLEVTRRGELEKPITLRVVDPANGLEPVDVTYRRLGSTNVVVGGEVRAGVRWEIRQPDAPLVEEIVDASGETLVSRTSLGAGLGVLEIARTTKSAAATAADGGLEILEAGEVRPRFVAGVGRPDVARSVELRVTPRVGELIPLESCGAQQVRREGDALVVVVTPGDGTPFESPGAEYLAATPVADHTDPAIRRFADRAVRGSKTSRERAETLRRSVHRHISRKELSTAFATAGETVRQRRGDCTEHAVLLAAALRSIGLPSRVVNGLIWIRRPGDDRGAYLWHMWTQVAIDEQWFDLDATLPPDGPGFHPGHLAITTGDLSPASLNSSGTRMLEVFGAIDIEVTGTGVEQP
ncbi:MAG: transglutaminase-like domain-containing protein [Phycisphaerales bacterium]|nr:transglutaminase-like domain-containing protein [Phycisphaerales bacterium]